MNTIILVNHILRYANAKKFLEKLLRRLATTRALLGRLVEKLE